MKPNIQHHRIRHINRSCDLSLTAL